MNRAWAPVLALLAGAACARHGYVQVAVLFGPGLAGRIEQLAVLAVDEKGIDAGPQVLPTDPVATGIPDGSVLVVQAPPGSAVTVQVRGLGADGGLLAIGLNTVPSATSASVLPVLLTPPCATARDCEPNPVCLGTQSCAPPGLCVTTAGTPVLATAGSPCGPQPAGHCDGTGTCLLPFCGDGTVELDAGEQCDDGPNNSDALPDRCRTNCQLAHCGDGVLDPDAGELCDLGARNGLGLGCNATCNLLGLVTTLAGSGDAGLLDRPGLGASFSAPEGLALIGRELFVADSTLKAVRQIDLATPHAVKTLAGGTTGCTDLNGVGLDASFCDVDGLLPYDGGLLATDDGALRFVGLDGTVTTFAGQLATGGTPTLLVLDGGVSFATALYGGPKAIAQIGPLLFTDTLFAGDILLSDPTVPGGRVTPAIRLKATTGTLELSGLANLGGLLYVAESLEGQVVQVDPVTGTQSLVVQGIQSTISGLCSDGRSMYLCISGAPCGTPSGAPSQLVQLDLDAGTVSLVAGGAAIQPGLPVPDGLGADAGFVGLSSCVYDPVDKVLYVSDCSGNTIREVR